MARAVRNTDELRKASDHLFYEIAMALGAADVLATGALGESHLANAVLESFTVHLRALLDVFYSDQAHPTDVIAEDFFNPPEAWTLLRPSPSSTLTAARRRVNKEVVHLTYDRQDVTPEDKVWPFVVLAQEIRGVVKAFYDSVAKEKLGERWDNVQEGSPTPPNPPESLNLVGATTNVSTPGQPSAPYSAPPKS